ncbi:MAG: hypothetical protein SFU53_13125 [Terrimicrobiaceae bacterium]|nr:hypothetical protein [Terrimicrobiaceae bacterium]
MKTPYYINRATVVVLFFVFIRAAMSIDPPPNIKDFLDQAAITEDGMLTGASEDQDAFTQYVRANWRALLNNIEAVAPTQNKQRLIVAASETLPGREYVQFLKELFELTINGKIDSGVFHDAIPSITSNKIGFLAYNYQDQQIRDWIEAVRATLQPQNNTRKFLDEVLSGDGLADAESATLGQGLPAPEILPPP